MFTKNQLERGAVAVRRPDGFNPQRTNPLGTVESRPGFNDPSKAVIHRLPVGQGFKPPVNRVKAKVIDSTENEDNFDEKEFTELYQVRNPNAFLSSLYGFLSSFQFMPVAYLILFTVLAPQTMKMLIYYILILRLLHPRQVQIMMWWNTQTLVRMMCIPPHH